MSWLATDDGLQPGDIHDLVPDSLEAAGMLHDVTIKKVVKGSYTPGGGPVDPTVTSYGVRGFNDSMSDAYVRGGLVSTGDRVVVVTQKSCIDAALTASVGVQNMDPSEGDKVICGGKEGTVMDVGTDPARALWVLGVAP